LKKEIEFNKIKNFSSDDDCVYNNKNCRISSKEYLISILSVFLNEDNLFFQKLALDFICGMLILEENFPNFKSKKTKFFMYFDEFSSNIFEIMSFLKKIKENFIYIDLIIIDNNSILFKLDSCLNHIIFPSNFLSKKGVGLLPIDRSVISTKGLKWDVGILYHFFINFL